MSAQPISRRAFVGTAAAASVAAAVPASALADDAWDEEHDVVIVGSGAAGLVAAVSACEADPEADVCVLESLSVWGGNSILNQGNYGACQTDVQIAAGKEDERFRDDNPDLYFAEKCKLGDYRMDPALTRVFADNALDGYLWLNGLGCTWNKAAMYDEEIVAPTNDAGRRFHLQFNSSFVDGRWIGCQTKGRHHKGAAYGEYTGGQAPMHALYDAATAGGVAIELDSKVVSIVREGFLEGGVLGVETADGRRIRARRGVVLAAGGYSANIELCRMYDPRIPASAKNTGCPGVDGTALIAAVDAGASTRGLDFVQVTYQEGANSLTARPLFAKTGSYINVDWQGARFWMETENKAAYRDAKTTLLHELGLETWWSVSDSAAAERLGLAEEKIQQSVDAGTTLRADTLEELAGLMGVPADGLVAGVERWNHLVEQGEDEDFGQAPEYMHEISAAPFYAEERCLYVHSTPGGVCIDTQARVLDRRGEVIPGLYAAGEVTGGVHGTERNGGCSWTDCTVFGRIAGAQAVTGA